MIAPGRPRGPVGPVAPVVPLVEVGVPAVALQGPAIPAQVSTVAPQFAGAGAGPEVIPEFAPALGEFAAALTDLPLVAAELCVTVTPVHPWSGFG